MKRKVEDLMKQRDLTKFPLVTQETTILTTIELMCAEGSGIAIVTDAGKITGVFSERDYLREMISKECPLKMNDPVKKIGLKNFRSWKILISITLIVNN